MLLFPSCEWGSLYIVLTDTESMSMCLQEDFSTYPDMPAYHCIAVTLGRAGHLEQLLELIKSLKEGPKKKHIAGYGASRLNWNGCLQPDIVVYNAVCQIFPFYALSQDVSFLAIWRCIRNSVQGSFDQLVMKNTVLYEPFDEPIQPRVGNYHAWLGTSLPKFNVHIVF